MTVPLPSPGDTDWIDWAGYVHDKVSAPPAADAVASVNGETGAVVLDAADVGARPASYTPSIADMPAGYTHTARKPGGVWEGSPTTRSDITIIWKGPDPSPPIVSSRTLGQAGMLDGVDTRFVTP